MRGLEIRTRRRDRPGSRPTRAPSGLRLRRTASASLAFLVLRGGGCGAEAGAQVSNGHIVKELANARMKDKGARDRIERGVTCRGRQQKDWVEFTGFPFCCGDWEGAFFPKRLFQNPVFSFSLTPMAGGDERREYERNPKERATKRTKKKRECEKTIEKKGPGRNKNKELWRLGRLAGERRRGGLMVQ